MNFHPRENNRYNEYESEARHEPIEDFQIEEERKLRQNLQNLRLQEDAEYNIRNNQSTLETSNIHNPPQMRQEYTPEAFDRTSNFNPNLSSPHREQFDPNYSQFDQSRFQGQYEDESSLQPSPQNNDNNMLIMQYESVLQSVNQEFQKLLNKNRQTEEELNISEMKLKQSERLIEDLKQQNMAEKMNEDKRNNMIQMERNELDNEMASLREQLNRKTEEIDKLNSKVMELEHQTSTTSILRQKVDELMNKNQQKDLTTREKEEKMFNLSREVESLKSDLRNMEHIENTLKVEIEELLDKRRSLEEINQGLKNQI